MLFPACYRKTGKHKSELDKRKPGMSGRCGLAWSGQVIMVQGMFTSCSQNKWKVSAERSDLISVMASLWENISTIVTN